MSDPEREVTAYLRQELYDAARDVHNLLIQIVGLGSTIDDMLIVLGEQPYDKMEADPDSSADERGPEERPLGTGSGDIQEG